MTKMMATPPAETAPPNLTPVTKESKGNSLPLLTWSRKLHIALDRLVIDRTYPESPPAPRRQLTLDANSIRDAWSNDPDVDPTRGNPEMALAAGHRNQQASNYPNAAHTYQNVVKEGADHRVVNQASYGDHG